MRERPILFSAEMVRAVLAGTKTQTRRIVTPTGAIYALQYDRGEEALCSAMVRDGAVFPIREAAHLCPYGVPGDRLWVRETWLQLRPEHRSPWRAEHSECERADGVIYRASYKSDGDGERARRDYGYTWRPSIFMRRAQSRITLSVESVRVERLHAITEEDARAEGVRACDRCDGRGIDPVRVGHDPDWCAECGGASQSTNAREVFASLWDSINAKRAPWSSNPWVWVVSFKRVEDGARRC